MFQFPLLPLGTRFFSCAQSTAMFTAEIDHSLRGSSDCNSLTTSVINIDLLCFFKTRRTEAAGDSPCHLLLDAYVPAIVCLSLIIDAPFKTDVSECLFKK